ncbi:MAG: hypothetical protein IKW74_03495 [Thermoguttaceae bacterium]|nr:hypothetical protein [Thermoguttaceae bacterium]
MRLIKFLAAIIIGLTLLYCIFMWKIQADIGRGPFGSFNSADIGRFLQNVPWWIYVGILLFIGWLSWYCGSSKCPKCHKNGALFDTDEDPEPVSRSPRPYWNKDRKCYVYKVTYRIKMRCQYCGYETTRDETKEVPEDEFTE